MNPTHIEHIGIAVTSLEESIPFFETLLGTKCYNIEEVVDQKVKTAFFKVGQTKIELLEPTSPELHHSLKRTAAKVACITSLSLLKTLKVNLQKLKLLVSVSSTRHLVAALKV